MAEAVLGKKRRFVEALIEGLTLAEASARCDRSTRTGRRWLADSDVKAMLSDAQEVRVRELSIAILAKATDGAEVIGDLMADPGVAPYVRLGAAKAAVDAALRLYEFVDLSERVSELERQAKARVM